MAGYYTASSMNAGGFEAVVQLSAPIDLTEKAYEIGLVYCSAISSWLYTDDLWMLHTSRETQQSEMIRFQKIPYTKESEALWMLSSRLFEEYGGNMATAPAKIFKDNDTWKLRIPKWSVLDLSPDFAFMLGLDTILRNESENVKDYPINFHVYSPFLEERLFFISCHQTEQNFTNTFGSNNRILSFIHAPEADTYVISDYTTARLGYVRLEENLLNKLTFSLFNYIGQPVEVEKYNFFVVFHIRPIKNE